ncbi:MAG: MarR family transcriptional regulator [Verrucomicrobia bacterium]|nr:MAG: MarR family transcriptional regulator [Verrucomicrobiota bacterium]
MYCPTLLEQASGPPTDRKKNCISARWVDYQAKSSRTVKKALQAKDYDVLSAFRYAMRKFLRVSKEVVAARAKLTPEQYEALLAIKSSSGANGVTVGEISERLQVRHHTAVSPLDRLEARKFAVRKRTNSDKRMVNVKLTKTGATLLSRLALIHYGEIRRRTPEIMSALRRFQK